MPPKSRTPKAPRTRKTPREKAEQALGVADRHVIALHKQAVKHKTALTEIERELVVAEQRRDYLAQSPDLPQPQADELAVLDTEETP
jgi:hypothetical protein